MTEKVQARHTHSRKAVIMRCCLNSFGELSKGGITVLTQPVNRAVLLGQYIVENKSTVRATAKKFGISKSTVHKDVSDRLKNEDYLLFTQVKKVLEINKQERHIRGGLATRKKYKEIAERKKAYPY